MKTPHEKELEAEARLRAFMDAERERSDKSYAIKLVEVIVFGAMGIIAISVLGALIAVVLQSKP